MGMFGDYRHKSKINEGLDILDENYAFFLTHVLKIGKPHFTEAIPTAAVAIPDKNANPEDFEYLWNPNFLDQLTAEEVAFISAHETMHILLNHLRLAQSSHFQHKKLFNIAADCVINDYLVDNGLKGLDGLCYGSQLLGHNCGNLTVTEVYDDLKQQAGCTCDEQDQQNGQGGGQQDSGEGNEKSDQKGKGDSKDGDGHDHGEGEGGCPLHDKYRTIDDHNWMHNGSGDQADNADELYDKVQDQMPGDIDDKRDDINYDQKMGKMAGNEAGRERDFMQMTGVSLEWIELLKELDPDMFRGRGFGPPPLPSYHKRPRKLGAFPDLNLPVKREEVRRKGESNEKPAVVMALDTSGSIGAEDSRRFISLAQTIPLEEVHLFPITFTTRYKELDLENPRYEDGGTSFACIQEYIVDKVMPQLNGQYPKAVVVVTDGCANFGVGSRQKPDQVQAESWYWLITNDHGYYSEYKQFGRNDKLARFIA